jgi:hypothetical protein
VAGFLPKSPGHRELQPKYRPGLKELIADWSIYMFQEIGEWVTLINFNLARGTENILRAFLGNFNNSLQKDFVRKSMQRKVFIESFPMNGHVIRF